MNRLAGTVCAGLMSVMVCVAGATAETTLRITLQLPITAPLGQNLVTFKAQVEAASGGDIKVEIYPSAQLFTDKEVPTAVSTGQIEMGVSSLARFAGTIPAVDIFNVPFLFPTQEDVRAATAPGSPVRGPLDAAMAEKGARPLWWQPYGLALIMLRDGIAKRPRDIVGRKIRTFGKAHEAFINALGGAATNISGSRQFLAYERGTVDGGMTGPTTIKDRKLYQVLDSVALTNHAAIEFVVLINEELWQGLSDEERLILSDAAHVAENELRNQFPSLAQEALDEAAAKDMAVYHPTAEDIAAWRAATQPLKQVYLDASGPLGAELLAAAETLTASQPE